MLGTLRSAVDRHSGHFLCEEINRDGKTKVSRFRHISNPPEQRLKLPEVPGLRSFYETFDSLVLYFDEESGDAAYVIASPSEWSELNHSFTAWLQGMGEFEFAQTFPAWIKDRIVVGEMPKTGNYLLVPVSGVEAGKVFGFDHDGFEIRELGSSLPDFVYRSLDLDSERLTDIAAHLRFMSPDDDRQWWITELRDNRGNVVRTTV